MLIKKLDTQIEKRILVGAVTSKSYLKDLSSILDYSYFQNSYIEKAIKWCVEFYERYEDAPNVEIENIIERETYNSTREEIEIYQALISDVKERVDAQENVNEERLLDQTIEYFKKRELEITTGNIKILLEKDDVTSAEKEIMNFRKISKNLSNWQNPFTVENIARAFDKKDRTFFKPPGKLGELIKYMDKGWLVAVCGPFKRGKSWLLLDFALLGVLSKKKTVFFSLEMREEDIYYRIYQRTVPGLPDNAQSYLFPCFDCMKNQTGLCKKPERINSVIITVNENVAKDFFDAEKEGYVPCTACRDMKDGYEIASWWKRVELGGFDLDIVNEKLSKYRKYGYDRFLRIKTYPRFSASVADLQHDLDVLENIEEYTPEIIVVDYADILKSEKDIQGVDKEDLTWMNLARLAGERRALVLTGTQLTRDAQDAANIKRKHTAKWIGKLAHVDAMLSINQTEEEKKKGVMRIGIMDHRHIDYSEGKKVWVLQNLNTGQTHLDSEMGDQK